MEEGNAVPARPRRRWLRTFLILVVLIAAALYADSRLYDRWAGAPDGSALNRSANAIQLGTSWTLDGKTPNELDGLAADLTAGEFSLVLADCGAADASGRLPARDDARVMALLAGLRAAVPELTIMARVHDSARVVNVEDASVRSTLEGEATDLVTVLGFDGVQFELAGAQDGGQGLVCLLQETRAAVGEEPLLSVVAQPLRPDWAGLRGLWSAAYYEQVAQACDILVFRFLALPVAYSRGEVALAAWETRGVLGAVSRAKPDCWVYAEVGGGGLGLKDAIRAVAAGARSAQGGGALNGLVLSDYDSATDADWEQWNAYWLGG